MWGGEIEFPLVAALSAVSVAGEEQWINEL